MALSSLPKESLSDAAPEEEKAAMFVVKAPIPSLGKPMDGRMGP